MGWMKWKTTFPTTFFVCFPISRFITCPAILSRSSGNRAEDEGPVREFRRYLSRARRIQKLSSCISIQNIASPGAYRRGGMYVRKASKLLPTPCKGCFCTSIPAIDTRQFTVESFEKALVRLGVEV